MTRKPETEAEAFARRLREAMGKRGASLRDIASELGCSPATVHRATNGQEITASHYRALVRWMT